MKRIYWCTQIFKLCESLVIMGKALHLQESYSTWEMGGNQGQCKEETGPLPLCLCKSSFYCRNRSLLCTCLFFTTVGSTLFYMVNCCKVSMGATMSTIQVFTDDSHHGCKPHLISVFNHVIVISQVYFQLSLCCPLHSCYFITLHYPLPHCTV